MYTGIVETTGEVRSVNRVESGCRLGVGADTTELEPGDRIDVSGVCLTAESVGDGHFESLCSAETVARTYLADLTPGDPVNLERPMEVDDRFDGHVVKGTVDTVTEVVEVDRLGEDRVLTFATPECCAPYLVEKGAVALDGVSLTVSELRTGTFSVAVVPATAERTTLSDKGAGDSVHVEADILAKYVERQRAVGSST
jgi:riboflavin synthase